MCVNAAIQRCVTKDAQDLGTEARVTEIHQRVKTLTRRETEVFAHVVTGMLNKQIARLADRVSVVVPKS